MNPWLQFLSSQTEYNQHARMITAGDTVACFDDVSQEFAALNDGVALVDRSYRAMLEVTGADRASWLHNLTTNQVKTLNQGDGHYAFALNLKGRILFDLNMFVKTDSILLDIDRRFFSLAQKHFQKYIITEDVTICDNNESQVRFSLAGPRVAELFVALGAPHVANLPMYGLIDLELNKTTCMAFRTDYCGVFAIDLSVPAENAIEVWNFLNNLTSPCKVMTVGDDAVQRLRIERGIPWPGYEITDEYLPAETGQFERAVTINKGCYLGQEIVERMRSRGVVARRLVVLKIESTDLPTLGSDIVDADGSTVGKLTSDCRSNQKDAWLGLGYIKSTYAEATRELAVTWEQRLSKVTVLEREK